MVKQLWRRFRISCFIMKMLLFVSLCISALIVSSTAFAGSSKPCCMKFSSGILSKKLIARYYNESNPLCPLHAVVFVTLKNRTFCFDPKQGWVQNIIKHLNEKEKLHITTQNSASMSTEKETLHMTTQNSASMSTEKKQSYSFSSSQRSSIM
ncbi:C-C motif chemokine 5-like [Erpetoichthys calabaricus]|uniref:C-C motif chemokine 5-like n=1 Tax=Erpetoichthys calabaricus TaxID=27687 RepID=UPI002233F858|nr:C-C motif chemokine 5-like [Erpetoichthys calabaricus]